MMNFQPHIIADHSTLKDALIRLNELSGGILTLFAVDQNNKMVGTVTDGDIRRALIREIRLSDSVHMIIKENFLYVKENQIDVANIRQWKSQGVQLIPCLNQKGEIVDAFDLKNNISVLPIDAVLMAGGKGERLRPLTDTVPKPLLKVGNKAIIDYNVDRLMSFGVNQFYITVNYLAQKIESHFKERVCDAASFICVHEDVPLGTIGSMRLIPHFKHDTILLMNSDLFTNIDFEDFYLNFLKEEADMAVATIPYQVNVPYAVMDLEDNRVKGLVEKPDYTYYANAGIYLIKKELLSLIPKGYYNATDFIELLISSNKKVVKYPLMGYWIDIGKPDDYKKVQEIAKHIRN